MCYCSTIVQQLHRIAAQLFAICMIVLELATQHIPVLHWQGLQTLEASAPTASMAAFAGVDGQTLLKQPISVRGCDGCVGADTRTQIARTRVDPFNAVGQLLGDDASNPNLLTGCTGAVIGTVTTKPSPLLVQYLWVTKSSHSVHGASACS